MSVRAIVRFTVDVLADGGGWGDDCTMGQVKKQAVDDATKILHRVITPTDPAAIESKWQRDACRLVSMGSLVAIEIIPEKSK